MPIVGSWEKKRVLITARTYPTPAKKGVEVSCTAGITDQGEWIRLFPIPYRFLESDKRFKKYQWIEVEIAKSSDPRPESYEVNIDSIHILGDPLPTRPYWQPRMDIISPLEVTLPVLFAASSEPRRTSNSWILPAETNTALCDQNRESRMECSRPR